MRASCLLALLTTAALVACAGPPPQGRTPYTPSPDMLSVLEELQRLHVRPVESLSADQARQQPGMTEAAQATRHVHGLPLPEVEVSQITMPAVQGAAGPLNARLYRPSIARNTPVILYFHGGGWVVGSLDSDDSNARELQARTKAIVLSVEYRLGPENRFPAAHDDALAAYRWLLGHAREIGGDPTRLAIAGESAGGNLALATAIAARDQALDMPKHLLLIYPVAGTDLNTPSMVENRDTVPLSRAGMRWFFDNYANGPQDLTDPRLDPVAYADLHGLPSTTIILAEIDVTRSDAEALAGRMNAAGSPTLARLYPGTTHGFFGLGEVVAEARMAADFAGERLHEAFIPPYVPPPTPPPRGVRRRR